MIKNVLSSFNFSGSKLFFLFLIISLKSINNEMLPNMAIFYLSQNKYMIITANIIYYYYSDSQNLETFYPFLDNLKITSASDFEMISYGRFQDNNISHLLVVKNIIYAIFGENNYCILNNDKINNYKSEVFPLKIINEYYYYIVGIIDSQQQLYLYLYRNKAGECNNNLLYEISISTINSENFNCQLMESGETLTCFYEINDNNDNNIIANCLTISYSDNIITSSLIKEKANNGAKIIKSKLSQDGTKIYVCYINNSNNCDCLTYIIATNVWTDYTTYISSCVPNINSLFLDYYESSDEYFLYCYETNTKINIFKLDDNLGIINKYSNDTFDFIHIYHL